ncbi:glycerophosphodiester phosphodiesterase [Salinimonas marina]|uniref:Glycerophosphodiester phosphodiesterase n=1 Tax=Salinimonas marina TaxID=2785918 RepID=A0A7S9HCZ6_9ALTE|nr:glycerophosphodiester phosphodiesterase family protein [Salinimonas marina]QPG05392.1 glycerophosphodiester phosphodiesterase [Salinimonas marina]
MWILAHRGASRAAPENTLKAFQLAFDQQADGIEFDTYELDSDIIVFHDKTLRRTTNGTGRLLDKSLSHLRTLNAGDNQQIPLLAEVLALTPTDALCNIEIKQLQAPESWLHKLEAALPAGAQATSNILISSFHHHWLAQIARLKPQLRLGVLTASTPQKSIKKALQMGAYSIHFALETVDEQYVLQAKEAGLKVLVYTVDTPADMLWLQHMGVDGIFTNVPDVALHALDRQATPPSL